MQNNTFFGHYQPLPIIVLEKTDSTNDYSKHLLSKFKPQTGITAIMTKEQTMGRGQRGTTWQSQAGANVTASFILQSNSLYIKDQFFLTIISSLAVYETIKQQQPQEIKIKWPNDILVNCRKIAGILIENKISGSSVKSSIIGIGVNVNQIEFGADIAHKTTSIKIENPENNVTIIDLIRQIAERLHHYNKMLERGETDTLLTLYNNRLFRRNKEAYFIANGATIKGTIQYVEKDGLLCVKQENGMHKYDLKDIVYQL